ncbi:MAG: HNH endonuclease [Acidobacteria bacterium]|nr:HNH endonuclease [Acidobacteriota bacterium]
MVVIRGRLTLDVGTVVQRALEAAADRLFRDTASASKGDAMPEDLRPAELLTDALALLAESALATHFDGGTAGDRYQVVVHVNAEDAANTRSESSTRCASPAALDCVVEVDHGAWYVSMDTSQRLSCDASLVHMRYDADGAVLDVGRKTRTNPPSIRRALAARDTGCRFPGCTSRICNAHDVHHWANGGATRVENLVLLCRPRRRIRRRSRARCRADLPPA